MRLNQTRVNALEKELNELSESSADTWSSQKEERRLEIIKTIKQLEEINDELPLEVVKCTCDAIVKFIFCFLTLQDRNFLPQQQILQ